MFNDLVQFHDSHAITTSLVVAEKFGKRHTEVLRKIQQLDCSEDFRRRNFASANYIDEQGKPRPMVEMTRDGFAYLAMGFTGKEAAFWKEQFIAAFNALEAEVLDRRNRDVAWEAAFRQQAEKHWFGKYPHWAVIHERVAVYSWEPSRIAQYLGRSVASVRRAIHRMIQVGILNPRIVAQSISGSSFARSIRRSGIIDVWGRKCEQLDLFGDAR